MIEISKVDEYFKGEHLNKPLIRYIYHPLALFLSWIYINLKIHAHVVNLLGLLASIIAAEIVFFMGGYWLILAGILVIFAYISDLCDGTVARFNNKKNAMGKWLDETAGFVGISLVFFSLMLKTFLTNQDILIIILGFAAIFGYLMMNLAAILSEVIRERFKLDNPAEKTRQKISKKFFGVNPSLFSFSFDLQWTIVALGVMLNQPYALFGIFAFLSNIQWMARYIIFWNK